MVKERRAGCARQVAPDVVGITYDVVNSDWLTNNIPVEVRPVSDSAELRSADEIWMTSSTREILPITRLDDQPVGAGKPGRPLAPQMDAWYQAFKTNVCAGRAS